MSLWRTGGQRASPRRPGARPLAPPPVRGQAPGRDSGRAALRPCPLPPGLRAARYRAGTGRTASRRDPLPSAPLRRVLRTPEASPDLGVRPHGGDTRRAPAPTSHARESLRPKRPYRPGIAKPKYPAGGDIGGRQKKHYRVWHRTLLCWEANTVVSEAKHSSVRTGNTIVLLFHAIQPTLAGWRVHPNDKHHKYQ